MTFFLNLKALSYYFLGDGILVKRRTDWFRPPKANRGPCTEKEIPEPCHCGQCLEPQGVAAPLYWDKVNTMNRLVVNLKRFNSLRRIHRHIYIPMPLFDTLFRLVTPR